MLSIYRNEPAPVLRLVTTNSNFDKAILDLRQLYPSARLIQNYGHTFLIDETSFVFIAFKGTRATKPIVCTSFETLKALNVCYYAMVEKIMKTLEAKTIRKIRAARKNDREVKPGSIFYAARYGDETCFEFFQIVAVRGRSVTFQKLKQIRTYQTIEFGFTTAVKDSFIDSPFRIRISTGGMRIDAVRHLRYWDSKPVYWSFLD